MVHHWRTRGRQAELWAELLYLTDAGTYKIPTANDIPVDLRVTLLKDAPNGHTPLAHSSKAIGEPPFFLGAAVFFALKVTHLSRSGFECSLLEQTLLKAGRSSSALNSSAAHKPSRWIS